MRPSNFNFFLLKVGAYHRAAYHFDQYIKEIERAEPSSCNYISSLLKIYGKLEEPDLVIGAAAVRKTEPEVGDLILLHKATGQFQVGTIIC